jgi:aspartyl/glutamyl-tRNA(Asn/Gln) amidotransferase C subunit
MMSDKIIINKNEAEHIADLVKLDITGQEDKFAAILTDTLKYIEVLDQLDTRSIPETYQVTGLVNVFQTDGINATLPKTDALSNAANEVNGLFEAEAVFDR